MKALRIAKYSILMFASLTALSTFTSMVIGFDNLSALTLAEYFGYQLLPSSILAAALYALMAKRGSDKPWFYAMTVFLISLMLGSITLSLLMQEFYVSPTWFIELPLSAFSAIIGTLIGIKQALRKGNT